MPNANISSNEDIAAHDGSLNKLSGRQCLIGKVESKATTISGALQTTINGPVTARRVRCTLNQLNAQQQQCHAPRTSMPDAGESPESEIAAKTKGTSQWALLGWSARRLTSAGPSAINARYASTQATLLALRSSDIHPAGRPQTTKHE